MALVPDFMPLPERSKKPRTNGVTHVIDTGLDRFRGRRAGGERRADYIDFVRLGWGIRLRDAATSREKLGAYRGGGVPVMLGGTLTELAWLRGKRRRPRRLAATSSGSSTSRSPAGRVDVPAGGEARADRDAGGNDFTVFAEVGEKDPDALLAPYRWVELIRDALEAGAEQVVCEGRATGDAGHVPPGRRGRAWA